MPRYEIPVFRGRLIATGIPVVADNLRHAERIVQRNGETIAKGWRECDYCNRFVHPMTIDPTSTTCDTCTESINARAAA